MTARGKSTEPPVDRFLPLTPAVFHILIALADGETHGYAIMQDIEERTGGSIRMSPGTLYGAISRLLEQGLISELPSHNDRRRSYRITVFGRAVAAAEAKRMSELLRQARASGLVPKPKESK